MEFQEFPLELANCEMPIQNQIVHFSPLNNVIHLFEVPNSKYN